MNERVTQEPETKEVQVIEPTVGRVVHFHGPYLNEPQAAIITAVHDTRLVNLAIFTPTGALDGRTQVVFKQPGDRVPMATAHACWMPYQVGQAAKTEDEVAPLAERVEEIERALGIPQGDQTPNPHA